MDPLSRDSRPDNKAVAGNNRPVCNVSELQVSSLFRSPTRSDECGNRRSPSAMGPPGYVRVPADLHPSAGTQQTQAVGGGPINADSPLLAPEGMVSGPSGHAGRQSEDPPRQERSSQTASFSQVPPQPPGATSTCLETVKRYARHRGFSGRAAACIAAARRRSTLKLYQHK